MRVIRINQLSASEAEHVVARMWCILERHQIASPRMLVRPRTGGLLDLQFAFAAEQDAELVGPHLKRLGPVTELVLVTQAGEDGTAIGGTAIGTVTSGDGPRARIVAVD